MLVWSKDWEGERSHHLHTTYIQTYGQTDETDKSTLLSLDRDKLGSGRGKIFQGPPRIEKGEKGPSWTSYTYLLEPRITIEVLFLFGKVPISSPLSLNPWPRGRARLNIEFEVCEVELQ